MGEGLNELAGRALGRLLELDARLMERSDPVSERPVDTSTLPWAEGLERGWQVVREELDAALAEGLRLPTTDELVGVEQGADGVWSTYVLHWYGSWPQRTCARFPRTVELLGSVPHLQIAGFTVLGPGAHISEHSGPLRSMRYHLGVRVPGAPGDCRLRIGSTMVPWSDGRSLAFDDLTVHEAWNDSDGVRYVLFVQTAWPARGTAGIVHAVADRALAAATSRVRRRADELDVALNG